MAVSATRKRQIDSLPMPPNPRKMEVFVVGLCRTGTTSLRSALRQFGHNTHGMKEALQDQQGAFWSEAIRLKYYPNDPRNRGLQPYGPNEFRKLFANYSAITDVPGVLFIQEIRETWPEIKIVVSNRDVNSWKKSMDKTILKVLRWPSWPYLIAIARGNIRNSLLCGMDSVQQIGGGKGAIFDDQRMTDGYDRHYSDIRAEIPQTDRLEFSVDQGWQPICAFLGYDVPESPFPHSNDTQEFIRDFNVVWWVTVGVVATKVTATAVLAWGGYAALQYYRI